MNILWITNIPSPYRVDFFNYISKKHFIKVIFENRTESGRDKNWYSGKFNFDYSFYEDISFIKKISNMYEEMHQNYDYIIISNYSTKLGILSKIMAKFLKKKIVLVVDGGFVKCESLFKKLLKRYLISGYDLYMSTGIKTNEYLIFYGADPTKIKQYHLSSISKDDILLARNSPKEKDEFKSLLNIKEKKIILAVGQFIPRKGFDILIKAVKGIEGIGVYIVGGNQEIGYLKKLTDELDSNIHFCEFVNKETLNKYYSSADLFILPTREDIWGLVINEAMGKGLPIITTTMCISGIELVDPEYLYEPEDYETLRILIKNTIFNDRKLVEMSKRNLEYIKEYTIESMSKDTLRILENFALNEL